MRGRVAGEDKICFDVREREERVGEVNRRIPRPFPDLCKRAQSYLPAVPTRFFSNQFEGVSVGRDGPQAADRRPFATWRRSLPGPFDNNADGQSEVLLERIGAVGDICYRVGKKKKNKKKRQGGRGHWAAGEEADPRRRSRNASNAVVANVENFYPPA